MIKVVLGETQKVYGLSQRHVAEIKSELTLNNPAYISARRFSKWSVTRIPPYLTFYDVYKDYIELPIGYELKCDIDTFLDNRVVSSVYYPPIKIKLRDTQHEAYRAWLKDTDRGVISMSTGKGKSILGIYCAYQLRQKTLVIVHKNDLVNVWEEDIELCFGGAVKNGLVKASKRKVGEQITIATIQTLNSMANKDLDAFNNFAKQFGMVIVDEMHHVSSSIYGLINHFPAQYKIGLTATPERSDGLTEAMYWYLGGLAYKYEYTVDDEDILPVCVHYLTSRALFEPQCYKVPKNRKRDEYKYVLTSEMKSDNYEKVLLEDVPVKQRPKISYAQVDEIALMSSKTLDLICSKAKELYDRGHNTIMFFSQKFACREYYKYLHEICGIPLKSMAVYNGDVKREDLKKALKRVEAGEARITLATYSIATEGTNVKAWDCEILCSSINNEKNVEQAVGRVRRSKEGKPPVAEVYDVRYPDVYTLKNHKWKRDRRYKTLKFRIYGEDKIKKKGSRYVRGY